MAYSRDSLFLPGGLGRLFLTFGFASSFLDWAFASSHASNHITGKARDTNLDQKVFFFPKNSYLSRAGKSALGGFWISQENSSHQLAELRRLEPRLFER